MRVYVSVIVIVLLFTGCLKKDTGCPYTQSNTIAPDSEEQMVRDYVVGHNINATKSPSNFYYEILDPGNGATPELCSRITINYTGKLTSGDVFDQNTNAVFVLGVLIDGWKKGIPLIQKGGHIRLYIPPSLGYGAEDVKNDQTGEVIIPGGSVLIFDVTLNDVS